MRVMFSEMLVTRGLVSKVERAGADGSEVALGSDVRPQPEVVSAVNSNKTAKSDFIPPYCSTNYFGCVIIAHV